LKGSTYNYSLSDIEGYFSRRSYERGCSYARQKCVLSKNFNEERGELTSIVQGKRRYQVKVEIKEHNDGWLFESSCSCPVGFACKHAVAALVDNLLSVGEEEAVGEVAKVKPSVKLNAEVSAWLKEIQPLAERQEYSKNNKVIIYYIDSRPRGVGFEVRPVVTSILKNGNFSTVSKRLNLDHIKYNETILFTRN
jgi:hypothetical protein